MFAFRSRAYGKNNKKVVFLLAGWTMTLWQMWLFSKILEWHGYFCITYVYDWQLLTPNVEWTRENCLQVKSNILQVIEKLKKEGYNTFYIFGTSLGSVLSLMVANSSPDISKVILNLAGADLAEVVWSWDRAVKGFKNDLQRQNVSLPLLKTAWKILSVIDNSDNMQDKKILMYLSRKDEIIPYEQSLKLIDIFKERKYNFKVISIFHFNHLLTFVFNLFHFKVYVDFLSDSYENRQKGYDNA